MTWMENLVSPEIRSILELLASIIQVSAFIITIGLVFRKFVLYDQIGIPVFDRYHDLVTSIC
jgi:hypothetical protein